MTFRFRRIWIDWGHLSFRGDPLQVQLLVSLSVRPKQGVRGGVRGGVKHVCPGCPKASEMESVDYLNIFHTSSVCVYRSLR